VLDKLIQLQLVASLKERLLLDLLLIALARVALPIKLLAAQALIKQRA
jgi:hypothetical protein